MAEETFNLRLPKKRYVLSDAGLVRRLFAIIIDLLILDLVIFSPFAAFFQKEFPGTFFENMGVLQGFSGSVAFVFGLISILALLYFTLFQYYFSQTYGMKIMKISVQGDVSFGRSLVRNLIVLPFFPFYLLWVIEPIAVVMKKSALLERVTGTRTIVRMEI
ncbi:MAG: RDD family protein [Nanoarchaeota archaeon]